MAKVNEEKLLRVIDANINRTKEGLRVCEDVCRFFLNDAAASRVFKRTRHQIIKVIDALGLKNIIKARNIEGDVGRGSIKAEFKREGVRDIFCANAQRAKESIRVLEEFSKLLAKYKLTASLKSIRYQIYAVEKKVIGKI